MIRTINILPSPVSTVIFLLHLVFSCFVQQHYQKLIIIYLAIDPSFFNEEPILYESFKNGLNPTPANNTGLWVLDNEDFIRWRHDNSAGLFCLFAPPQCGKSVISRALVDKLLPDKVPNAQIIHFFFKDNNKQNSSITALRAMLLQIFSLNDASLHEILARDYAVKGNALKDSFEDMWRLFIKLVKASKVDDTICVLDGLDECKDSDRSVLIEKLNELHAEHQTKSSTSTGSLSRLRFFVTSRPYDEISWDLEGSHLYAHDHSERIQTEIQDVVQIKVRDLARKFALRPETQQMARASLSEGDDRT